MPNTVCPSCGKDAYEREGNVVWVKGGVRFEHVGGRFAMVRCGHCGWERPGIKAGTVTPPAPR